MYAIDEQQALNALRARSLHEFVECVEAGSSDENFVERFSDFVAHYGFTSIASVRLPTSTPFTTDCILVNTRPRAWVEEYLSLGYLDIDPVLELSLRSHSSFTWGDLIAKKDLTPSQAKVMNHSADHNISDGFVIPVFESNGRTGIVSLAGTSLTIDPIARSRLTLAAVYLQNRLSTDRSRVAGTPVSLTKRENEILKWIATGKSDWQIGQILNISQKTVNYHVENTKRKYGVATRIQAVVAALRQGTLD